MNLSTFDKTINKFKKAGIDSMCFIYHFEASDKYGELVKQIFLSLQDNKLTAVTSVLTLAEVLSYENLQKDKIAFEEEKSKLHSTPNLNIIPVDEKISEAASILKYHYSLSLPDAIQLATSVLNGQEVFISNDIKLKKVKEIKVIILDDFLN